MLDLAENKAVLRKRLIRLLEFGRRKDREEFTSVIFPRLSSVGRLVLIGGAVRDVAREGASKFKSDLDFVIYKADLPEFYNLMERWGGVRNRFGGYGLTFDRWRVDVWALEDTWARTVGLRDVSEPSDLLECTFFDWDAVLFDLSTREIISRSDYFDRLNEWVLDINLEENPNPRGAIVRALRRGYLWRVKFGDKLSDYVERGIKEYSWDDLVLIDTNAFSTPLLRAFDPDLLELRVKKRQLLNGRYVSMPFADEPTQLAFPF